MSLATSFTQISPTRRIPIFIAEFQPTGGGQTTDFVNPPIILAQKLPAASAVVGQRYLISSVGQAASLFGRGSPAHLMVKRFLKNRPGQDVYVAVQTDADAATAATATLTWTGPASAAGTIKLYIAAQVVTISVASGASAETIATAVTAAVNAVADLPVTCATGTDVNDHVNTLTCKVEGTVGNQVTVELSALGQAAGEELPAGVGCTVAATLTSGATDPTASLWADSLGEVAFDTIVYQTADTAAVAALKSELEARWNANSAIDGFLFTALMDSKADLLTYAAARNYENLSTAGYPETAHWLTPAFEVAAAYGAIAARRLAIQPSAPIHFEPLLDVWAGGTNFSDTDRDALANGGVATLVTRGGSVFVEFEATTRRLDAFGEEDHTYDVIQTPYTLSRIRRRFGSDISNAYREHILVSDGTTFGAGVKAVTPSLLKAFVGARYRQYISDGLAEDFDAFVDGLIIERDASNPNRINGFIPVNLANQFRVFAAIIGFTV